jgi:hypothetical protein
MGLALQNQPALPVGVYSSLLDIDALHASFHSEETELLLIERADAPNPRAVLGLAGERVSVSLEGDAIGLMRIANEKLQEVLGGTEIANRTIEDILAQIDCFASLTKGNYFSGIFSRGKLPIDDCIFHTDGYQAAMLCTYDGPGTEYALYDEVNWKAYQSYWEARHSLASSLERLQSGDEKELGIARLRTMDESAPFLKSGKESIRSMSRGSIGIWKGDSSSGRPLLHRMPRTDYPRIRFMIFAE